MSWSAHQFETYVLQKHFGRRITVSYLALALGDMIPDSFSKVWVYGFTVHDTHYGASDPAKFHRGFPGAGFTHSLLFGVLIALGVWLVGRPRPWAVPWAVGILIGQWGHSITDINDTQGTMLFFPFTTHQFSIGTWAYAAQVGKHRDAAAYFSSLGFAMDVLFLAILVIFAREVLTRTYFRRVIVTSDPYAWAWIRRRFKLSERELLAIYRALFIFAIARLLSWTFWAHYVDDYPWDLSWGGPDWVTKVPPSDQNAGWLIGGAIAVGVCCILVRQILFPRVRIPPAVAGEPERVRVITVRTAKKQRIRRR